MRNDFVIKGDKVFVKLPNSSEPMICDKDKWEAGLNQKYWRMGYHGYARTSTGFGRKPKNFHILAFPDCPKGKVRDHIDGNKLNNCASNIRYVTMQQNSFNRGARKTNVSKRCGVAWIKSKKVWRAYIRIRGKYIQLGEFDKNDFESAVKARENAEIQYFGEYRRR